MSEGKKNDQGKPKLSIIPTDALWGMARALTYGASKYSLHNFRNGIHYTRLADAAMRHLTVWMEGEELDSESGNSHLDHALASLAMLKFMSVHKPDFDDRWKPESTLSPEQQEAINNSLELIKNNPVYPELIKADLEEKEKTESPLPGVNIQYEQNIQEFEKFFGLDRKRFLDFSNDKGLKK